MSQSVAAARPGVLVVPDGLAALRTAILAMRSTAAPRPAPPGSAADRAIAAIPSPSPPSEPTGEQATVMDLVRRAQAGDTDAFAALYDRYLDVVYRYIYYRVSNVSLTEDLTSETFLRALRRLSSYTWQGRDFGAWLVTIARNLIADHFKSGRYRLELTTADMVEAGADRSEDGPEGAVLAGLTSEVLLAAVRQLGPEQQECISLRFLQGLSVAETAAIMGKNDGAIKALQYRAVKALARLLPEDML